MKQSGFTLIEAVIAGSLSVVVAGVILALLRTNNAHVKDGIVGAHLAELHSALSAEIARLGRNAWIVKTDGDPYHLELFDTTAAVPEDLKVVVFCNRQGDTLGGFRILEEGGMEELDVDPSNPPVDWKPFSFGPETVNVNSNASSFSILPGRRGITYSLSLKTVGGDVSLQPVTETVLSRNAWVYK